MLSLVEKELQMKLDGRFDNEDFDGFEEIYTFIEDNFEVLDIKETIEIEW